MKKLISTLGMPTICDLGAFSFLCVCLPLLNAREPSSKSASTFGTYHGLQDAKFGTCLNQAAWAKFFFPAGRVMTEFGIRPSSG